MTVGVTGRFSHSTWFPHLPIQLASRDLRAVVILHTGSHRLTGAGPFFLLFEMVNRFAHSADGRSPKLTYSGLMGML